MHSPTRFQSAGFYPALAVTALLAPGLAAGHHSSTGIFDQDNFAEIDGVVTSVQWRNPHVYLTVDVVGENGATVEWNIESGSVSGLRQRGVTQGLVNVGDRVRMAGESSLRGRPEMFATNLLLPDGRELLMRLTAKPRWPELRTGMFEPGVEQAAVEQARRNAEGIFRVWSTVIGDPDSFPMYWDDEGPLTEAAARAKAEFDARSSPFLGCHPKGMPYIMITPYPIEFSTAGDDILIRFEEHDVERLIHMNEASIPASESHSLFGYSIGRWEDGALVVETERVNAPYFYGDGTPLSEQIRLVERFTVNDAGDRLDYALTVDDPLTFVETMEFTRYFAWNPAAQVQPYNCNE